MHAYYVRCARMSDKRASKMPLRTACKEGEIVTMKDIRLVIAENLAAARKASKMTQAELAEKLNYSDKAISKWERGESIPDVLVLKEIAELFSVTVDYFLTPHEKEGEHPRIGNEKAGTHTAITLTSCIATVAVAVLLYIIFSFVLPNAIWRWKVFVAMVPVLITLCLIFNAIWGRSIYTFITVSGLLWSCATVVFVFIMDIPTLPFPSWSIFFICIPLQIIVMIWALLLLKKQKLRAYH